MPLRQWLVSANNAIEGIVHSAKTQRHLRYHFYAAAAVLIGSYSLGMTKVEFLFISLAVITVLVAEMMNTAFEAVVDLLSPEYHERARHAKDIAAGAVLITALGALVVAYIIILPYIQNAFDWGMSIVKHPPGEIAVLSVIIVMISVVLIKAYTGKGHPLAGGMPSGHAAMAFSVWVSVTMISRSLIISGLCLVLSVLIAQSRVSVQVHRPIEVIAGAALGSGVTYLLFLLFS